MAQRIPTWAVATGTALVVGGATAAMLSIALRPIPVLCKDWVDPSTPGRIRDLAKPIERLTNMKGLGEYLAAISWIESRGNVTAGSSAGNAARGALGIRPVSARVDDLGLHPDVLKDLPSAVGLATWYVHRCQPYADPYQVIDWLAIRRCWGYPSDVDDVDHPGYRDQLEQGYICAGGDPNDMFDPVFRWNYNWPGIEAIMDAVGRPLAAA